MKCKKCGYEWVERIVAPKECPECKTRLKIKRTIMTPRPNVKVKS